MQLLTELGRQQLVTWLVILGILVSILASIQTCAGVVMFLSSRDMLYFVSGLMPSGLMLVTGVAGLPASLRVAWISSSYHIHTREAYRRLDASITYMWAALIIIAILNLSSSVACFCLLITQTGENGIHVELGHTMHQYRHILQSKRIIDQVQLTLQCCGIRTYRDWFKVDWQGTDIIPAGERSESESGRDAVPFSCCSLDYPEPCIHQALRVEKATSINCHGCLSPILRALITYFSVVGSLFFLCAILQIILVILARLLQTSTRSVTKYKDMNNPSLGWICCLDSGFYEHLGTESMDRERIPDEGINSFVIQSPKTFKQGKFATKMNSETDQSYGYSDFDVEDDEDNESFSTEDQFLPSPGPGSKSGHSETTSFRSDTPSERKEDKLSQVTGKIHSKSSDSADPKKLAPERSRSNYSGSMPSESSSKAKPGSGPIRGAIDRPSPSTGPKIICYCKKKRGSVSLDEISPPRTNVSLSPSERAESRITSFGNPDADGAASITPSEHTEHKISSHNKRGVIN